MGKRKRRVNWVLSEGKEEMRREEVGEKKEEKMNERLEAKQKA